MADKRLQRYADKAKNRVLNSPIFKRSKKHRWVENLRGDIMQNVRIPDKRFAEIFEKGKKAASKGSQRVSPYSFEEHRLAWYIGYDSYDKDCPTPAY